VKSYPKGSQDLVSKHFKAHELDCPCSAETCKETLVDCQMMEQMDAIRDEMGVPVKITSGNRCAAHQAELKARGCETAVGISQHELGMAVDFETGQHTGEELEQVARRHGFVAVGVGKRFIHADMRADKIRRWTYSY
jgi:uncharacterized protein YcbK (DUF882 family)